jgi:secondary thiamine-phosphate synthase enzyme
MRQATHTLDIETRGRGLVEITRPVVRWAEGAGMATGLLTLFCRHTSASLLIQENADPDVRTDLEAFFADVAPEEPGRYVHDSEGPDDMPAHIRTALTQVSLSIPLVAGRLALGTWQGIYLFEHRRRPHRREVVLHLLGA